MKKIINTEQILCSHCEILLLDIDSGKEHFRRSWYEANIKTNSIIETANGLLSGEYCSSECLFNDILLKIRLGTMLTYKDQIDALEKMLSRLKAAKEASFMKMKEIESAEKAVDVAEKNLEKAKSIEIPNVFENKNE